MPINEILSAIREHAVKDKNSPRITASYSKRQEPFKCVLCAEQGSMVSSLYEMGLIDAGESVYAAMKQSINGGGENSPALECQKDYYAIEFIEITSYRR